jgi:uridine phosphorylase
LEEPFYTKSHHFAMTGSGQTWEKWRKMGVFRREYEKATISLDCDTLKPLILEAQAQAATAAAAA